MVIVAFITKIKAQAIIIEEEFNGGTTAPTGWSFNSIGSSLSTNSNYGKSPPSVVMDATGDQITSISFAAGGANTISFWAQSTGATPSASDLITVEYFNGSWNNCSPATFTFNTTARMFESSFPATATSVRITYTKVTSGVNVAIDDFTILNKTTSCTTSSFLWFSSITYNSCSSSPVCEGTDEFLSFQNGNTPMNLSDLEINVPATGTGPEGTTFCGTSGSPCDEYFTTNATYVASLNGVTGCTGFFLSPPGNVIPAGARVIVFMGNPPGSTINFSNLCASGGNYYCVFVSNTTNCTGRYSNNVSALRFTTIRNRSTGCSVERSFTPSNGINADGDVVAFSPTGAETYSSNPGCSGFAILPIELKSFSAAVSVGKISLNWEMEVEELNSAYIIEKSEDAENWSPLTTLPAVKSGTYSTSDDNPVNGINYYRLLSKSEEGVREHKIISVNYLNGAPGIYIAQNQEYVIFSCSPAYPNCVLTLQDITGRTIREFQPVEGAPVKMPKGELGSGMFLLHSKNYPQAGTLKLIIN